jgi:hypothetical protein
MAEGAVMLAKHVGAPVLLVGLACNPAITLDSWDRSQIAAAVRHGVPSSMTARSGSVEMPILAPAQTDWSARLSAATRQAEAML